MAKPHKVEEPAGTYSVSKDAKRPKQSSTSAVPPAQPAIRYVDNATFRKASAKVFKAHDELFRKLAQ